MTIYEIQLTFQKRKKSKQYIVYYTFIIVFFYLAYNKAKTTAAKVPKTETDFN